MGTRRALRDLGALLLLAFAAPLWGEVHRIEDLSFGVYDTLPGNMIPDEASVSITNLHVDPYSKGLLQRDGSLKKNSSQLSGSAEVDLFTYVQQDGDEFLIAFASKTVAYSSDNGATFTTLITTATDGEYWDCAGFVDDKFYCVSQGTSAFSFNGTIHAVTTQTPAAKYIEQFENRLWVANTSANPGRLFFSGLLLPTSWTTSTDFIDFDEPISGLGVINGGLAVYGDNNTWMVRGDDPTNFSVDKISRGIGCANNRTIKNMMLRGVEVQVFLSKGFGQTTNNFFANDGIRVSPIGGNYLTTLTGINIGNASARSRTWDIQSEFAAGTVDNTTTTVVSGSVILSTNNTNVENNSFENGTGTDADNWTETEFGIRTSTETTAQSGSYVMSGNSNFTSGLGADCSADQTSVNGTVYILDANFFDSVIATIDIGAITTSYVQKTINLSAYTGMSIKLELTLRKQVGLGPGGCGALPISEVARSDAFLAGVSSVTFYVKAHGTGNKKIAYDLFESGRNTISSGTYTSEQYQTDTSLSQWGVIDFTYDVGTATMTFYVKTATGSTALTNASFQAISDGQQISTTTNQFIQWKVVFTTLTASPSLETPPTLDEVVINWISASGSSQQPDSEIFEENYWMTYPGPSETRNQSILVINKDGAMYNMEYGTSSQHGFYGFTTSNGLFFAGDSSTQTTGGYVWQLESGELDDGEAVTSEVQLKHQEFDSMGLDDFEKSLQAVYFNYAVQPSGDFTATIQKNFSESSTDYTIPLSSGTSVNRYKIEPIQQTTARQIGLKFTNSTSGQKLKLYPPITYHFEKNRMIKQQR